MADHLTPEMRDENARLSDEANARYVYRSLVRMALAAGWRRLSSPSEHWNHPDHGLSQLKRIGEVTEIVLRDHGVDLRAPVPGEEATPDAS